MKIIIKNSSVTIQQMENKSNKIKEEEEVRRHLQELAIDTMTQAIAESVFSRQPQATRTDSSNHQ